MEFLRSWALFLLLFASADAAPPPQDARLPIPEPAAQAQAEKIIKDLFKEEYAKRSPDDQSLLAKKLFQQAVTTTDDMTNRYVLLREVRDLSAQAGDLQTALLAIDDLVARFRMESVDLVPTALATASKSAKTPEALEALATAYLTLSDKAIAADRYDEASAYAQKAETAAKAGQNVPLVSRAQNQRKDIAELQKEGQRVKAAEKTLVDQPDDPAACFTMGRFLCLVKKDWPAGLALLVKGSDAAYQLVAQKELATPTASPLQAELGDAWWEMAEKTKDLPTRRKLLARARLWYERALQGSSGLTRAKIDRRLDEIDQAGASGPTVDLLALIDPKKDALSGAWDKSGPALLSPVPCAQANLQIPYIPPPEYDLKLIAEKKDIHDLHLGLPSGDARIEVDVDNQSTWGTLNFSDPSGKNIVKYNASYTAVGRPATILVSVRRTGVTVTVDGKVVLRYDGDTSIAKAEPSWKTPNSKALSVGTWAGWIFTKMLLVPVSGQGRKLR